MEAQFFMNAHKLFYFLLSLFHPWHLNISFITFFILAFLMSPDSSKYIIRCGNFLRDRAWFAHKFVFLLISSFSPSVIGYRIRMYCICAYANLVKLTRK